MASNKNALIRYKTIDSCLRNSFRQWTLEKLIDACSDALYEYEGKDVYVSKRTVQLDIQVMRSDKLGYNAPIEVYDRKFYRYTDPEYSIRNIPVTEKDVKVMNEAIQMLRQFKDFSLFKEMDGVLQRLEDSVHSSVNRQRGIIHLDKNDRLKGLEWIDVLYQAILSKKMLSINYQSFKAESAKTIHVHPQLLKEFNNRWFLLALGSRGAGNNKNHLTLALDRMVWIKPKDHATYIDLDIDGDAYYRDVVGVTVSSTERPRNVKFWVDHKNAPYVLTKPLHASQTVIEEREDGIVFKIQVQHNFELERLFLGFGESLEVISPKRLRKRIQHKLQQALARYAE